MNKLVAFLIASALLGPAFAHEPQQTRREGSRQAAMKKPMHKKAKAAKARQPKAAGQASVSREHGPDDPWQLPG